MEKFELLENDYINLDGRKLYRIRALIDFTDVYAGDLGGYVEKEENLSQKGNAWVYNNACVYGNAIIYGKAWVRREAEICGDAIIAEEDDYIVLYTLCGK